MSHIADQAAIRPRPHHYMNADGTCHAGDIFEAGTDFIVLYSAEELVRIVNHEKAEAWDEGYRSGLSNAMRRMSDEPDAPTTTNPYAAHMEH
jgi:hypothetical protein